MEAPPPEGVCTAVIAACLLTASEPACALELLPGIREVKTRMMDRGDDGNSNG